MSILAESAFGVEAPTKGEDTRHGLTGRTGGSPSCIRRYIVNGVLQLPDELREFPGPLSIKSAPELVSLGNLRTVKGGLFIWDCVNLRDFGQLHAVSGPVDCQNCPKLEDVSQLEQVRGFIDLEDSLVSRLPQRFQLMPLMPKLKPFMRLSLRLSLT